ncbi:hypothetical protein ACGFWD_27680 [Streptomyces sp. NPDC048448]|uniref:Uncharacterized protein n=1 Tax=Streptomyces kaempferi TaxID=333725 RepID=A0ABW3XUI8_9ACTN|nr:MULTISPECIES: hypothetical protein [unclassified Streptomyces]QIY60904.1 hypothetical protein HEP85_03345 [Streptomyces sp. RPA4-2]
MRSRFAAVVTAATLGALGLILATGAAADAASRPAVTKAECVATGGVVFDIPMKTTFCLYDNHDGTIDIAPIVLR